MVDPVSLEPSLPIGPAGPARPAEGPTGTGGFAAELRQQLEQVNQVQAEAEAGIEGLLTGRSDNVTEVLAATRKAEVAFSLLMEIRNKLVDAYTELKQLRV
jgi:flagellar hook-basal body complex protein FliE